MWLAILNKDIEKLKVLSMYFNVPDFYGMFACIISGRSWDSINKGIEKTHFTENEVYLSFYFEVSLRFVKKIIISQTSPRV
jgi:hypothetical protein